MTLSIDKDYESLSQRAAHTIISLVKRQPRAVLCLATGDTPKRTYALIATLAMKEKISFDHVAFIGLDEWIGIPPDNEGSCAHFLRHHVFEPLGIRPNQIHLFDAMADDLEGQCDKMNHTIEALGGIDLALVGVGMNGHIGFNEPAAVLVAQAHIADLDERTTSVGQKYFKSKTNLKQGVTLGMDQVMHAKTVIMMANGRKKAEVIGKALEAPVSPHLPASMIREHANGLIMLDEEAASLLTHR